MNYKLIFDVATHSDAPLTAAYFGMALAAVALTLVAVIHFRGQTIGVATKFFMIAATLILLVSVGSFYEKKVIASQRITEGKSVEGVVVGHWTSWERTSAGSKSYNDYEGFYVNGTHFSYTRSSSGNYFGNNGDRKIEIRDGMRVRLQYLPKKSGDSVHNQIIRFETAD